MRVSIQKRLSGGTPSSAVVR